MSSSGGPRCLQAGQTTNESALEIMDIAVGDRANLPPVLRAINPAIADCKEVGAGGGILNVTTEVALS
jgi:hypothetical protein